MPERTSAATGFAFILDGSKTVGYLKSFSGGAVSADVIHEAIGPDGFAKKHIGPPRYQEFTVQVDMSMTNDLYDWINASWQLRRQRKSGAVVAHDFNYQARSRREFFSALITEVGFPACDAVSKDPSYLTVKFAPEYTRYAKASGKIAATVSKTQKVWLPSNFRLTIDGLDCSRVTKIDGFSVTQRNNGIEASGLEFPNLTVWLPEALAETWLAWHENFVVNGANSDDQEKSGTLEFLAPDLKETLLTISFGNVGIFNLNVSGAASGDQAATVSAEIYCERMELLPGKVAAMKLRAARASKARRTSRRRSR
jgi:hypothetical protein